jgi:hypothetical protein
MTRKHFEVIARLIAEAKAKAESRNGWTTSEVLDALAGDLAIVFKDLNPRFDTVRFIEATKREV